LAGTAVGGGSDGNFTAAVGVPTLDGLGAVGGGAHADHEHVLVHTMPGRVALAAGIIRRLVRGDR
jgi:glutamate carboxypeptidase